MNSVAICHKRASFRLFFQLHILAAAAVCSLSFSLIHFQHFDLFSPWFCFPFLHIIFFLLFSLLLHSPSLLLAVLLLLLLIFISDFIKILRLPVLRHSMSDEHERVSWGAANSAKSERKRKKSRLTAAVGSWLWRFFMITFFHFSCLALPHTQHFETFEIRHIALSCGLAFSLLKLDDDFPLLLFFSTLTLTHHRRVVLLLCLENVNISQSSRSA